MSTSRVWFAAMCMAIAGTGALWGCGDPGVTEVACAADPVSSGAGPGPAGPPIVAPAPGPTTPTPAPTPCPTGYMCVDLTSVGAVASDGAGNPVTYSCGMGGLADCNDADPAGSCPDLPNPICVHVEVAGMSLVGCGQVCAP